MTTAPKAGRSCYVSSNDLEIKRTPATCAETVRARTLARTSMCDYARNATQRNATQRTRELRARTQIGRLSTGSKVEIVYMLSIGERSVGKLAREAGWITVADTRISPSRFIEPAEGEDSSSLASLAEPESLSS